MTPAPLTAPTQARIRRALEQSWSNKTSVCFNPDIAPRSYGQCAPTAVVVFEMYGGEVLRTAVKKYDGSSIRHFYNRIGGQRYDFTADQFNTPGYWGELSYDDIASSVAEAKTETLSGQLEAMRTAFAAALSREGSNDG